MIQNEEQIKNIKGLSDIEFKERIKIHGLNELPASKRMNIRRKSNPDENLQCLNIRYGI